METAINSNAENLFNHLKIRTNKAPLRHGGYTYFVNIVDSSRSARFISDGKDHLQPHDFTGGQNAHGVEFYGSKQDVPGELCAMDDWWNDQDKEKEIEDMKSFISRCLQVPILYEDTGVKFYEC